MRKKLPQTKNVRRTAIAVTDDDLKLVDAWRRHANPHFISTRAGALREALAFALQQKGIKV